MTVSTRHYKPLPNNTASKRLVNRVWHRVNYPALIFINTLYSPK